MKGLVNYLMQISSCWISEVKLLCQTSFWGNWSHSGSEVVEEMEVDDCEFEIIIGFY